MDLGLMKMNYPSTKPWHLGIGIPQGYTDTERANIFESVKGFASKIGRMLSTTTFYPEAKIPATPEEPIDEEDEDDEDESEE